MTCSDAPAIAPGRPVWGQRRADAGFTLIETLVALAVLALSAVAILGAAQAHVARVAALEARAAALWAAQNHLAEIGLGLSPSTEPGPILGYRFRLQVTPSATADPGLTRLDITATEIGSGQGLARLTGFVLAPEIGGGA
jgi:general secretion pathway protein I